MKTEKIKADLDFSSYEVDHFLSHDNNKKVLLKFKDETGGKPIREFIALKPKLYLLDLNGKSKLQITPSFQPHSYSFTEKNYHHHHHQPPPSLSFT